MIRIKVEEEEEVTPLSIESENNRIKRLLSLKFSSNNNNSLNNVGGGSTTSDTNSGNFSGTLKEPSLKLPENNVVVPMKVVPKKKPKQKLDNFTTDFVAVGLNSIKTEPAESSLSLSTNSQLNQSLNFQSLLIPNEISIPNGTQQQQQSLFLPNIEPIVSESQEVLLFLDPSSFIPNGTQQQHSLLLPKTEPIVPESQQVSLSLDLSSLIPNLNPNSGETLKRESDDRLRCYRKKVNLKPLDSEVMAKKRRRKLEYFRKYRQKLLANATPEQREQKRLKEVEKYRRRMEKESEEQREQRLERGRQYAKTVDKQRRETMTPEERENKRDMKREYNYNRYRKRKEESLEKSQSSMSSKSLEQQISMSSISSTSMNDLVLDNSTLMSSHRNYSSKNNFIKKD